MRRTVSDLIQMAEVIPLDSMILRSAAAVEMAHGLSGQDAIVLASVLAHLERSVAVESCFLNRNARDFDDPD
ncbi:MAG: PIN domain-containing protein, partial [Bryobacteraceae bacterium]